MTEWVCEECKAPWDPHPRFPNCCRKCGNMTRVPDPRRPTGMRFYVAGPYSDRPGRERPGDIEEENQLYNLRMNYPFEEFVRPYDIDCGFENPTHAQNMHADCKELLCCDAIVLRPGWSTSRGAMIELALAVGTGRPVYTYVLGHLLDPEHQMVTTDNQGRILR